MNCLIRIRQRYAGFAQSDKKLADFCFLSPTMPAISALSSWQVKRV